MSGRDNKNNSNNPPHEVSSIDRHHNNTSPDASRTTSADSRRTHTTPPSPSSDTILISTTSPGKDEKTRTDGNCNVPPSLPTDMTSTDSSSRLRKYTHDRNGSPVLRGEEGVANDDVTGRNIFVDTGSPRAHSNMTAGGMSSYEASRGLLGGSSAINKALISPITKHNQYQVRKSAARALMDAALMMANISQLRTVIELGPDKTHHYYLVLGLTVLSLVMQIVFAVLMFFLLMKESEIAKRKDYLEHLQLLESAGGLPKETVDVLKRAIVDRKEDFEHDLFTTRLNYATIFLVFVVTVVNMFITGFGVRTKGG